MSEEDVEKLKPLYTTWRNAKWQTTLERSFYVSHQSSLGYTLFDENIGSYRNSYMNVHSSSQSSKTGRSLDVK